jgi:serine/threonine-protein kinase RsbT
MGTLTFVVQDEDNLLVCRTEVGAFAVQVGFDEIDRVRIATAVSEIARNALIYGGGGQVTVNWDGDVLSITVEDHGPGIPNLGEALQDGYSSSGSLGIGLPGAKRLMDAFTICSNGHGTLVTMQKALRHVLDTRTKATSR